MYHQCMSELDEKIFGMLDLGELGEGEASFRKLEWMS